MNNIFIPKTNTFEIGATLNCGQVFRYKEIENGYRLFSLDKTCDILAEDDGYILLSKDIDYFYNYLDFDTDYESIQKHCKDNDFISKAISFGQGIHILKQDPIEATISFVVSQNNHIPRIKAIIERMCEGLGKNIGNYYAFPTLEALANAGVQFYKEIGAGYRSEYLNKIANQLLEMDIVELAKLPTPELRTELLSLYGVGRKVADCALLFGFNRFDVFPVDTWILKVFGDKYPNVSAEKLSELLVKKYGKYSGFIQQWLFYYKREQK